VRGTRGWFGIGGFGIQPVELVKIFMIVYFARFFGDYARHPGGLKHVVGSGLALAAVVGLVILQPDFGSALLLMSVWGGMVLLAGVKRSHLVIMAVGALLALAVAWLFVLKPYQKDRITTFMDPDADPLGRGYNVTQSIIAIGSGQVTGRGLGFGSQSQLRFLPERQTDFIFAVLAEELGFFGVLMVLALFGMLFHRCYLLAKYAHDDFTLFLTIGIAIAIGVEMFTNLGGNLRILPVTGVTLPFVSYGGSSLLTKFLMIGLLQSVAVRR
jgi:rod shape determining protein RodA